MDAETREQYANKILGENIDKWWNSDIGQYVLGRSLDKTERLTAELRTVDPEDSKRIRDIQFNIRVAEQALVWLNEQIHAGQQALNLLDMEDDLDN